MDIVVIAQQLQVAGRKVIAFLKKVPNEERLCERCQKPAVTDIHALGAVLWPDGQGVTDPQIIRAVEEKLGLTKHETVTCCFDCSNPNVARARRAAHTRRLTFVPLQDDVWNTIY